jgi:hypothetical protein
MTMQCDSSCFTVSTVPPPPGETDAYNARTRVAPLSEIVIATMGVDLVRSVPPPTVVVHAEPEVVYVEARPLARRSNLTRLWPVLIVAVAFGVSVGLTALVLSVFPQL